MSKSETSNESITKDSRLGLALFFGSLIFYFLLKLPFNLSVTCSSTNEGFYLVFGQHFLNGRHLYQDIFTARGPLFIMFYALIVKIFGFGTWSIIVLHLIHTFMVILIGIVLYFLSKKMFDSTFYTGLCVLFWILIQITPMGSWGPVLELNSTYALEGEYFCVLLSICTILCLMSAAKSQGRSKLIFSIFAGLLTTTSAMFKANGAVIGFAVACFLIYLFIFNKTFLTVQKNVFIFYFGTLFLSLALSIYGVYLHNGELNSFIDEYYLLGQYSKNPTRSITLLFVSITRFMFRYTPSISNLIMFSLTFLGFGWGMTRNFFLGEKSKFELYWPLLSIWGIGSVAAVIAPGGYGSYYYILLWPLVAIFLVLILKDMFCYTKIKENKAIKNTIVVLISAFFILRVCVLLPTYIYIIAEQSLLNIALQPESFEDPVKYPYNECHNSNRPSYLRLADLINNYLPNKNDTVYVFNFTQGHQDFAPTIYVYSKRYPPTTVYSDWLHYDQFLNKSLKVLIKHLTYSPPKIVIIPKMLAMRPREIKFLIPFFEEFETFLQNNYYLKNSFSYLSSNNAKVEVYEVYERKTT